MSSILPTHPLRLARPLGLISRTKPQHHPQSNIISQHGFRHYPGTRSFHIAPTVLAITQTTQDAILSLHSITHLPWFLVIPLIATGISIAFRLPTDIYVRKIHQRRAKLTPILQAWNWTIARDIAKEGIPSSQQKGEAKKRITKTQKRIFRSLGLQEWKMYANFLGLPFWLIGIESIRRLCGGPRGIIGSLFAGPPESTPIASSTQGTAEATTQVADTLGAAAGNVSAVDTSAVSTIAEHAKYLPDPSIALEGCLWFPDLTIADPYHILPFALSVILISNVLPKTREGKRLLFNLSAGPEGSTAVTSATVRRLRLNRALLLLSGAVGPITMDLPAAIHLYWLCSSATHLITSRVLSSFMPIKQEGISFCKGEEANIIRPHPSEKPISQSGQQKKMKS